MKSDASLIVIFLFYLATSCNNGSGEGNPTAAEEESSAPVNYLTMRIKGNLWTIAVRQKQ